MEYISLSLGHSLLEISLAHVSKDTSRVVNAFKMCHKSLLNEVPNTQSDPKLIQLGRKETWKPPPSLEKFTKVSKFDVLIKSIGCNQIDGLS